jgi:hypothetical protein
MRTTSLYHRLRAALLVSVGIVIGISASLAWIGYGSLAQAQGTGTCQTFTQTGHKVCGTFLVYWNTHGGLIQQGYPLSEEFTETSDLNGKPYTVQYFERAVFEMHPENQPPYDVLLSQLGTFLGKENYVQGFPANSGDQPFYENRDTGIKTLKSYYNAVNRKEYDRAYSYFEGAPNPDPSVAPPYQQFVSGYADTASVALAVGTETVDAGAGNLYSNVPVVLIAKHTDGSTVTFSGCYILHRLNFGISGNPADLLWSIRSAKLTTVPNNSSIDALLAQKCTP